MKATRKKTSAANAPRPASRKPAGKVRSTVPAKRKKATAPSRKVPAPVTKETMISNPFWNIWDTGNEYKIRISVPGLSKKDIKVSVNGNNLTISSDSENKSEQSKKNYIVREYSYNAWSRTVALPKKVSPEDIRIKYKDGVLKLDLPKVDKQ